MPVVATNGSRKRAKMKFNKAEKAIILALVLIHLLIIGMVLWSIEEVTIPTEIEFHCCTDEEILTIYAKSETTIAGDANCASSTGDGK